MSTSGYKPLDAANRSVRTVVKKIAKYLDQKTKGKLTPNTVTFISFVGHLIVAWLIADSHLIFGAVFLIIFGLMDALDGELARLQHKQTSLGMLLDASSDRVKEVILYSAIAFYFIHIGHPYWSVWALIACGMSICVSYVKAKGETARKQHRGEENINDVYGSGLLRYEFRMFLIVLGLLFNLLPLVIIVIAVLATYTVIERLIKVAEDLDV